MTAVRFRFRPLTWTGPVTPAEQRRSRYTFKATYSETLVLLDRELSLLGAAEAVVEAGFREQDIRIDRLPRANARVPEFPGVRVAFTSRTGPLICQTDVCETWQHNLRSIALGLEALRAVDRYGITSRGEQYTGFTAIEAGPLPLSREQAAVRLGQMAACDAPDPDRPVQVEFAYRIAARRCHPDTGGSKELFQELQAVMGVLR